MCGVLCVVLIYFLIAEEEKRRKKDRRPKGRSAIQCLNHSHANNVLSGTFHTWYDIGLFHNVRAGQLENRQSITYRGKIKLHGTNVAVSVQHNGNQVYIQRFGHHFNLIFPSALITS